MPLLPRKGILAIAAVIEIAVNGRPVAAKLLATRYRVPPRHLEPVLRGLVRHGILNSVRGPHGGYGLAREQRNVSADDILRAAGAVEESEPLPSSPLFEQVVMLALAQAEQAFWSALGAINVEDLTRMAESIGEALSAGS
jgi:Rrf2 family protein